MVINVTHLDIADFFNVVGVMFIISTLIGLRLAKKNLDIPGCFLVLPCVIFHSGFLLCAPCQTGLWLFPLMAAGSSY